MVAPSVWDIGRDEEGLSVADEFREIRELRQKFMRAVYDLRDPALGAAYMPQIAERMGLDPNSRLDADTYVDIAQYFDSWAT